MFFNLNCGEDAQLTPSICGRGNNYSFINLPVATSSLLHTSEILFYRFSKAFKKSTLFIFATGISALSDMITTPRAHTFDVIEMSLLVSI
jgi:hypothetical protein